VEDWGKLLGDSAAVTAMLLLAEHPLVSRKKPHPPNIP
jgi:hypothetical protein